MSARPEVARAAHVVAERGRSEPCGDAQASRGHPAAIPSGCCEVSAMLAPVDRKTAGRQSFPLR